MTDAISLGVGEPDFDTPWHIREAGIYALEKGKTHYTSNLGLIELRRAISRYVEKNYAVSYAPENEVIITVGVSEALDLACRALINPGDKVIITSAKPSGCRATRSGQFSTPRRFRTALSAFRAMPRR